MNIKIFVSGLLITVVMIFSAAESFCQEGYNQIDSSGLKQGKWVKMWNNGMVKYRGQFRDDKPYGEFKYFYPSGKLKVVLEYSEDGSRAHNISYYENGKKMAEGDFVDQKKEGKWKYFSEEDEKLILEENYKNGKLNGEAVTYYHDSGKPFEILEYKNGVKDGEWMKYFPEGQLMTETFYKNGVLEGTFVNYTPEGKLLIKGWYKNGEQDGVWEFYDEKTGDLLRKEYFKEGRLLKTEPEK